MIYAERHTESQAIKAEKTRQLIAAGYSIYAVSELLNVGFAFVRRVCRDMPGAAERDRASLWLPEDDEANVSQCGVGYWVPSPDEIKAMAAVFDAIRLSSFFEDSTSKRNAERYAKEATNDRTTDD